MKLAPAHGLIGLFPPILLPLAVTERGGLGTVVALRVDHSIADGLSLIVVARSVLKPAGPDGGDAEDAEDGGAKPGFGGTGVAEAVASGCRSQMKTVSSFGFSRVREWRIGLDRPCDPYAPESLPSRVAFVLD